MRVLYVNNFRGFKETFIPISRANFLVGENSTGKTSILKLIKLLSDFPFKYTSEFYSPDVDLGRFEDIVSKYDSKIKFFEIGFFAEQEDVLDSDYHVRPSTNSNLFKFTKIKFIEKKEKTIFSEISFKSEQAEIFIKLVGERYQFTYKFFNEAKFNRENPFDELKAWMVNGSELSRSKTLIRMPDKFSVTNQLRWVIMSVVDEIGDIENKKQKNASRNEEKRSNRKLLELMSLHESFFPNIKWIAPIRAEPKRIYEHLEAKSTADGSHAPQILKEILLSNTKSSNKFKLFIEKFGKSSHLFDDIKIRKFGSEKFAPFEIQVFLEGKPYSISNVGYGISQILPLLLEVFDEKNTWLAIQQPEVHLHPRAQAEFGQVLFDSIKESDKFLFVETHSDFTIDRFRYCINQRSLEANEENLTAQVLYFSREGEGNKLSIIPISDDGSYSANEVEGFRDFFVNEAINLIGI